MKRPPAPRSPARPRVVDADLPQGVYRTPSGYRLKLYFDGAPYHPGSFDTLPEAVAFRDRWLSAMRDGVAPPVAASRKVIAQETGIVRRGVGRFEAHARHAGIKYRVGVFRTHEAAQAALAAFHRKHAPDAG